MVSPLFLRRIHAYCGALFAPAILFFAVTGILQVFGLHEAQAANGYQPPPLVAAMGQLHKDQKIKSPDHGAAGKQVKGGRKPGHAPEPLNLSQTLLKGFVTLASAALIATTLLGLYMALRNRRDRLVAGLLFLAGIVVPLALISI